MAAITRRPGRIVGAADRCPSRRRTSWASSPAPGSCPRTAPRICWPTTLPDARCRATRRRSRCPATTIQPIARSWNSGAIRDSSDRGTGAWELSTVATIEKRRTIMAAKLEKYCAPGVYDPPGYSQAIKVTGAQTILFLAGQVPYEMDGTVKHRGDFRGQARTVFGAVKALVEAGCGTLANAGEITTHLTDRPSRAGFFRVSGREFRPDGPALP